MFGNGSRMQDFMGNQNVHVQAKHDWPKRTQRKRGAAAPHILTQNATDVVLVGLQSGICNLLLLGLVSPL